MKTVVFHVNMLQEWTIETGFLGMEAPKEKEGIPFWNDAEDGAAKVGNHLTQSQVKHLHTLQKEYDSVFQDLSGLITLVEHHIHTDQDAPVRLPPYRIPQVHKELKEMLAHGTIEPRKVTVQWSLCKRRTGVSVYASTIHN